MSLSASAPRKTDAALQRLEDAIARLETALASAPPARSPARDLFGGDALTSVHQDYARLDQASRQVESRLDRMADRLQTLLES